ncbi:MAG TPA: hypothetical protein VGO47_05385, partial [Chlamydiales bacterium]|nr:hypothetical protein [Chlamydiales bacterium]
MARFFWSSFFFDLVQFIPAYGAPSPYINNTSSSLDISRTGRTRLTGSIHPLFLSRPPCLLLLVDLLAHHGS